jgi:alpha-L-fucosidase
MRMKSILILLLIIGFGGITHSSLHAQNAAPADRNAINTVARPGDMMADSPVKFPKEGALPGKYPPDLASKTNEATEPDYYIFKTPERSLAQIATIQAGMPAGEFTPPTNDWRNLPRTYRILTEGGDLRLLALGDSIVNDTMRSGWVAQLQEAYPKARIEATGYVRGGGGCQHYKEEGRVAKNIIPRKPNLVLIGGISQKDIASIREVIHQLRAGLPEVEILLTTGVFGTTDPRDADALAKAPHSGTGAYGRALMALAAEEHCAYMDMTTPWAEYIRSSKLHPHLFYRDAVHANESGEQILGKIMMAFWTADGPWLEKRLAWFQDLKFGFMMHWAPYSLWGCVESWPLVPEDKFGRPDDLKAWTDRGRDMEQFTRDYWALPKAFNPTKLDPRKWAAAAGGAGMKYVVFTTKHHDGFCMFDTKLSDYRITAPDVPFHSNVRSNVVKEVFNAFRKKDFAIGAYFSKADWHSPDYWDPSIPAQTRNPNYDTAAKPEKWKRFVDYTHGQIEELMTGYGPIDILWLDAGQVRPPQQDIQMPRLAAMARSHQPGLIVVDRTVTGPYENYRTPEQEVPDKPLPYTWETCMTMGDQWSFKPNDNYKSTHRLIHLLVDIVGKGGNFLLNVGPQPDGQLPAAAVQRMNEMGDWMHVNGEAIYGTRPIAPYKEGNVVFTRKGRNAYAIYLTAKEGEEMPANIAFSGLRPVPGSKVQLLGVRKPMLWQTDATGLTTVAVPASIIKAPPCKHAFVLKFEISGQEK